MESKTKKYFTTNLLKWFEQNERPLPWKGEQNPYLIWLSEIILQQTRVEQGLPYFQRFKKHFPTVKDLADAPEDQVMKLWQGLGYYARARNLHATAKYITYERQGQFPSTYQEIRQLKGVGNYTAAAIASFAYGLPYAVVDGNVYRVLSRYFGIETPIDTTLGKKTFSKLADELLDKTNPAKYNQAIMDFGAVHCLPRRPKCSTCLHQANCIAYNHQKIEKLPIKSKKIKKKERFFNFLVINYNENVLITKRQKKDIWKNLYQFPLIETKIPVDFETLQNQMLWQQLFKGMTYKMTKKSKPFKQVLTHQKIVATFWEIKIDNFLEKNELFTWIKQNDLSKFAFPKIIDLYLKDKSLYLNLL